MTWQIRNIMKYAKCSQSDQIADVSVKKAQKSQEVRLKVEKPDLRKLEGVRQTGKKSNREYTFSPWV